VELGLSSRTLRDPAVPMRWEGVAADDSRLLEVWLGRLPVAPDELHTSVPVGMSDLGLDDYDVEWQRRFVAGAYPRRIDAIVRFGHDWWLIECKPAADHYCLGQILAYAYWWECVVAGGELADVVVLTDEVAGDCMPVFAAFGVTVIELGRVLDEPVGQRRQYIVR